MDNTLATVTPPSFMVASRFSNGVNVIDLGAVSKGTAAIVSLQPITSIDAVNSESPPKFKDILFMRTPLNCW